MSEDASVVLRRLIGTTLALALLGSAAAALASASTEKLLYRTDYQAEQYLEYGLKRWAHHHLGKPSLRSAFCISGYSARPEANEHYSQRRLDRAGKHVYRTFACTLNVVAKSYPHALGVYLKTTRSGGWRIKALHNATAPQTTTSREPAAYVVSGRSLGRE